MFLILQPYLLWWKRRVFMLFCFPHSKPFWQEELEMEKWMTLLKFFYLKSLTILFNLLMRDFYVTINICLHTHCIQASLWIVCVLFPLIIFPDRILSQLFNERCFFSSSPWFPFCGGSVSYTGFHYNSDVTKVLPINLLTV